MPEERYVPEKDAQGNITAYRVERESEWDEDQRLLAIASQEVEAETPPHGWHISQAMDPALDPNNPADPRHFVVGTPHVDFAQKALDDYRDAYRANNPETNMNGLLFTVDLVDE